MKRVVLCDLIGCLGSLALAHDQSVEQFQKFRGVDLELRGVHAAELPPGGQLAIGIWDSGNLPRDVVSALLRAAEIFDFFDPNYLLLGVLATLASGEDSDAGDTQFLFVSPNPSARMDAQSQGMEVSPHLSLVPAQLRGEALHYFRAVSHRVVDPSGWSEITDNLALVPCYATHETWPTLYGIAADSGLEELEREVDELERLADEEVVAGTQLAHLRFPEVEDQEYDRFKVQLAARSLAVFRRDGAMLALSPAEELHLRPPGPSHGALTTFPPARHWGDPLPELLSFAPTTLIADEVQHFKNTINPSLIRRYFDPWVGYEPTPVGQRIHSRWVGNPGNVYAAIGLASELQEICEPQNLSIQVFPGVTHLMNVEARIPGRTNPDELVVVGAHLDSTLNTNAGFDPNVDRAPGGDDDASGMAGVLAAAKAIKPLADAHQPRRSIYFVLFNAEEVGKAGSAHYTNWLRDRGKRVVAMIQMDMIGWTRTHRHFNQTFEIHTVSGGPSPFKTACENIADAIVLAKDQVSPSGYLLEDVYPHAGSVVDPAAGSSDHVRFHAQGWPACLVSEDLFVHDPRSSYEKRNASPLHTIYDCDINTVFAAHIARSVAAAAWSIAK